jgi:hypothetical protein
MDDREIAKIIRKRNLAYVKHLNETSSHTQSHDKLEGGFLSAIAAAARIAAKMAMRAAKAGAKAAAKAAKAAAKATKRTASAAAKAAKKAASAAAKAAKKAGKNIGNKLDTAMNIADVGQAAARIAQNLMKKTAAGEEITDEEFEELTAQQQIEIDFQRWARGLERADYELFKARGGDKSAALQLARLMDAGMDPDDWVGKEVNAIIDATTDELEDALDYDPNDDDECEDELDKDDRSDAEINGLIALSLIDQGLGEFISEQQLERRQRARRDACVRRKSEENDRKIGKLKEKLGIDPDDPDFDIDDIEDNMNIQSFILGKLAVRNPNVALALELDGPRSMAGLPPVDAQGTVFNSDDNRFNTDLEIMAMWLINNNTLDYTGLPTDGPIPTLGWANERIRQDPNFIQRAIAKMPYYTFFASENPDVMYQKATLTQDYVPRTAERIRTELMLDGNPNWRDDMQYQIDWTVHYNPKKDGSGNMLRNQESLFFKSARSGNYNHNPVATKGDWWYQYPLPEHTYQGLIPNKKGAKAQQRLEDLLVDQKDAINAAAELVTKYDERQEALTAKDPFVPNKAYVVDDLIRYNNKVYKCTVAHTSGNEIDLTKWDELTLVNEDELDFLENIGTATPYANYTKYPIGVFVTYNEGKVTPGTEDKDRIFKKIKDSEAGIPPTETDYWDEILLNDADLLNLQTDPGRKWVANKRYSKGDKVFYERDLQTYVCLQDTNGYPPGEDNAYSKAHWKRLYTFNIDPEMAKEIIKNQRLSIFSSVVKAAEGYDPAEIYQLRDVVYAFDGKYYELIKEKKNKEGELVQPPIPPSATYWKVVSKGITVWDPKETYNTNDFVQYTDGKNYLCFKDAPAGTLPTDANFWEPLDEEFELLDEAAIAVNTENFQNAVMERADEYQDDPTASYEVDDIVKVYDTDGYPQFYKCIKDIPFGRASGTILRKAKSYDFREIYQNGMYLHDMGVIYEKINTAENGDRGLGPPNTEKWKAVGYEKDPGPPNPEFWKDYSSFDAEEERYDKQRKSAKTGSRDLTGIKVGDLVVDPKTGEFYKLMIDTTKYIYDPSRKEFTMRELPPFDNDKKNTSYLLEYLTWEPQDIPTELEAKIANIEKRAMWRNDRLYKRDDLVMDQYKFKYLCIKDTPYAPMEPRWSPDYFILLDDADWEEAVSGIKQILEKTDAEVRDNEAIRFDPEEKNKPYKWDEIVYHDNKFYKFQGYMQDGNNNWPVTTRQKIPGVITGPIEWILCTESGDRLPIKDTDNPGVNFISNNVTMCMYSKGGPIIQIAGKYYVYNNSSKEIFGGNPNEFFTNDWWALQSWGSLEWKQGPEDTMTVEVFADGKPVNKHDLTTGAITGKNVDVSSLPKAQATAVADAVEEGENDITCPTAEDDGDDDDDDTHHEEVQAERELEKAMIEWVAKGSDPATDPRLVYNTPPPPPPPTGKGAGYNIEELDGSQYHQKKKRVYKRKNKSKM